MKARDVPLNDPDARRAGEDRRRDDDRATDPVTTDVEGRRD
jgi:hypothetical protein